MSANGNARAESNVGGPSPPTLQVNRTPSNFFAPGERLRRRRRRDRLSRQPDQALERQQFETLFLDNLKIIEGLIAALCRRYGLTDADADDCASWLKLRILQDDYGVLRKFRGESTLTTYLSVVIAMLFRDYRIQQWGRWRPSAAARHEGMIGIRLETLVVRDQMRIDRAGDLLRSRGETSMSDVELSRILSRLPLRFPLRPVTRVDGPLPEAPSPLDSEDLIKRSEAAAEWAATDASMCRAVEQLDAEDRLVVRLRFWEGLSVVEISRATGIEQKRLYRRLDRVLMRLRRSLEAAGVSKEQVRSVLDSVHA